MSEATATEAFEALRARVGDYTGEGVNYEGQPYRGTLSLRSRLGGKGLAVRAQAVGTAGDAAGAVFHDEESTLALRADGALALFVLSSNHPGVVEHLHDPAWPAAEGDGVQTVAFRCGAPDDGAAFREVICFDLWADGAIGHRYAWGLPGGEFAERSGARLASRRRLPVPEAPLAPTEHGRVAVGPGWYVLNAADAKWLGTEGFGRAAMFEGTPRFEGFGLNVHVLNPGEPACYYHGEADPEAFLVLEGECTLVIEGEQRALRPWDFVYCPPWARHVFVGAGDGPCAVLMVGGRGGGGVTYPLDPIAQGLGACPAAAAETPAEAYAGLAPLSEVPGGWPLG